MYHESVFSLRQDRNTLSKEPVISRVKLSKHVEKQPATTKQQQQELTTVSLSWRSPSTWIGWIESKRSADDVIDSLPTRQNGFGYVLGSHLSTVDPIEAGAEFHEDSLGDR